MTALLADYGMFLLKTVTLLAALAALLAVLAARRQGLGGGHAAGHIEVTDLRQRLEDGERRLRAAAAGRKAFRAWYKAQQKASRAREKNPPVNPAKSIYVIDFKGDMQASQVSALREEISAVLAVANKTDEVVLRLESGGGVVHGYGLAASQLQRIRDQGVPLTVCVDKVAASGGYLMACLADRLLAAPFAIVGSIGVVGQLPNLHRLLKKHAIDYELHTAGTFKRTLTLFGENTEPARQKFIDDINETHRLFKAFVAEARPQLDIESVATGEIWFGTDALPLGLIDSVGTSDAYLADAMRGDPALHVLQVHYRQRRSLPQRLGLGVEESLDRVLLRWLERAVKGPTGF